MKENTNKLQEAIDVIFGKGMTSPEYLIEEFEAIYRAFAYNHICADEDAKMCKLDACDALYNLETLIDGLKGKNIA